MLEELVVELDGRRFIGHLYAGRPAPAGTAPRRWRFSCCGCMAAEFPATDLDTPDQVRTRLQGVLRRTEGQVLDRRGRPVC